MAEKDLKETREQKAGQGETATQGPKETLASLGRLESQVDQESLDRSDLQDLKVAERYMQILCKIYKLVNIFIGRPGAAGPRGFAGDAGLMGLPGLPGAAGDKGERVCNDWCLNAFNFDKLIGRSRLTWIKWY